MGRSEKNAMKEAELKAKAKEAKENQAEPEPTEVLESEPVEAPEPVKPAKGVPATREQVPWLWDEPQWTDPEDVLVIGSDPDEDESGLDPNQPTPESINIPDLEELEKMTDEEYAKLHERYMRELFKMYREHDRRIENHDHQLEQHAGKLEEHDCRFGLIGDFAKKALPYLSRGSEMSSDDRDDLCEKAYDLCAELAKPSARGGDPAVTQPIELPPLDENGQVIPVPKPKSESTSEPASDPSQIIADVVNEDGVLVAEFKKLGEWRVKLKIKE